MLFIYNTIVGGGASKHFDLIAKERLFVGVDMRILHIGDAIPDLRVFSHLLLTGSELSASQGSEYDESIFEVIDHFVNSQKAVYGICHGHQMLARFLAGDECCRRAIVPEFGFKRMTITDDELFGGIDNPVFLESRYDEVIDLPDDFQIIAHNELEAVQAFRYKNLPIWGTQFHPEFLREDGDVMLEKHLLENPQDRRYYRDDWVGEFVGESLKIFENFLGGKCEIVKL